MIPVPMPNFSDAPETGVCVACRTVQPVAGLEEFGRDQDVRCIDEDACKSRFTPRRLALSVRLEGTMS